MVRFIRCYDVRDNRMVNVWQNLSAEQAARERITGVEWVHVGETFEDVMAELEKIDWIQDELPLIRAAYKNPHEAKPPVYYTLESADAR